VEGIRKTLGIKLSCVLLLFFYLGLRKRGLHYTSSLFLQNFAPFSLIFMLCDFFWDGFILCDYSVVALIWEQRAKSTSRALYNVSMKSIVRSVLIISWVVGVTTGDGTSN
jgi:hypothetical protein